MIHEALTSPQVARRITVHSGVISYVCVHFSIRDSLRTIQSLNINVNMTFIMSVLQPLAEMYNIPRPAGPLDFPPLDGGGGALIVPSNSTPGSRSEVRQAA